MNETFQRRFRSSLRPVRASSLLIYRSVRGERPTSSQRLALSWG